MGQAESVVAVPEADTNQTTKSEETSTNTDTASSQPSLEDLITEATNYSGNDENESLEVKAQRALECPCVAELRKGPCGTTFSEAFVCFIKSTAEEKGSDCVSPFIALQNCIKANPKAFSKDVFDDEDEEDDATVEDIKIIPPAWAGEPKSQGISKFTPSSPNLVGTPELKNAIFIPSTQCNKNLSSRREFVYGIIASGIVYSTAVENANAAGKRGPPPPPTEKQDPSITGVRAKVLASMKRKEAMKEEVAKLREKGKLVN